jgi:pantothenate kinase type III
MQGLITLDLGNTNPHAGLFQKHLDGWSLIKVTPLTDLQLYLSQLKMNPHNSSIVVCEVKSRQDFLESLVEQGFIMTKVKDYWRGERFAGMPVNYAKTLGEDRLMEAFYSFKHHQSSVLLINAGTFVTMDVITPQGFLGGYIIPGTQAYFEAYQKGEKLQEVLPSTSIGQSLPQTTSDAISHSYSAFVALAKTLINNHQIEKILLSGGSASLWGQFFEKEKSSLVVEYNEHLIHWALLYWMTTQIEPL